jgi:quinol monooxygenase YgiN
MERRAVLGSLAGVSAALIPAGAAEPRPVDDRPGAVTAVVTLEARAGRVDDLLALLHPVLDAMRQEATFVSAVLHRDPADPTRLMVYETWADLDELATVQVRRDYRRAYEAALPELLRAPRRVELWQPLRSDGALARLGCSR